MRPVVKIVAASILCLVLLLVLSATSGPTRSSTSNGNPIEASVTASARPALPAVDQTFVVTGENTGYFVVGGSGTCPPEFNGALYEHGALAISLKEPAENRMCTMDYRLYAFDVKLAKGSFTGALRAFIVNKNNVQELQVASE